MPLFTDAQGNVWDATGPDDPNPVFVSGPQQGAVVQPGNPYAAPRAQAETQSAQANAQVATSTTGAEITKAMADARRAEAEARRAEIESSEGRREYTQVQREEAISAFNRALDLDKQITKLRELYDEGPGQTSGPRGARDYLPLTRNERFDAAGNAARAMIRDVLGFTGTELNTPKEIELNIGSYIPSASDRDAVIEDKLAQLESIRDSRLRGVAATLGGIPDRDGNIVPLPEGAVPTVETINSVLSGNRGSALDQTYVTSSPAGMETSGERGVTSDPIPPEMQQAYQNWVLSNAQDMTPQAYNQFRQQLDRQFYGENAAPQDYTEEGQRIIDGFRNGGTLNLAIPPVERPLTEQQQAADSLANSPVGAATIGALNMGGFGGVEALAPDRMAVLRGERPGATMLGEIGGAMTGTAALGRLGREAMNQTAGRVTPDVVQRLLANGGRGQFGRNLATDATYSGAYGGMTGQDPLETAAFGAGGSAVGQVAGKAAGRAISGAPVSEAVEYLRHRNIPLTTGQTLGGLAKSAEDRLSSVPLVGDMVNARRMEGLDAFNRTALADAGESINFTPTRTGREGVADLMGDRNAGTRGARGAAYDAALSGLDVSLDQQFLSDTQAAVGPLQNLPGDIRRPMGEVMAARIQPIADAGRMDGPSYQAARRALAQTRNKPPSRFEGFEPEYQGAASGLVDALDSQVTRGAGPEVVQGLDRANRANRLGGIVEDAAFRADGNNYTFTPSQLQDASKKIGRKFPGQNPLLELADMGQEVLPSRIPDSGTAGRFAQLALPSALAGGGAGVGFAAGGGEGAQTGAASGVLATALLALGGTRSGQRALNALFTQRPEAAKKLGRFASSRAGLFGRVPLPATLNEY